MDEFFELCKERAMEDGQYAIAFAILLTGRLPSVETPVVGKDGIVMRDVEVAMVEKIERWLIDTRPQVFCALDIWVYALDRDHNLYNETTARRINRAARMISGVEAGAKRNFDRWGQQRYYRYSPPRTAQPLPQSVDEDLGI